MGHSHSPKLSITPRGVVLLYGGALAALLAAFGVLSFGKLVLGRDSVLGLVQSFDLLFRATVPSWFVAVTLGSCALLCAGLARTNEWFRPEWGFLGLGFLFFSIEQVTGIGRTLILRLMGAEVESASLFPPPAAWLVVSAALVALLWLAGRPRGRTFVGSLPPNVRGSLLQAAAVYLVAAIGLRSVAELYLHEFGWRNVEYYLLVAGEWTLEAGAIVWALRALVEELALTVGELTIGFSAAR